MRQEHGMMTQRGQWTLQGLLFLHQAALKQAKTSGDRSAGRAFFLPMNFLEKTLRDWNVTLLPMAARKPGQLKLTSLAEASATPPTTGSSDSTTGTVGRLAQEQRGQRHAEEGLHCLRGHPPALARRVPRAGAAPWQGAPLEGPRRLEEPVTAQSPCGSLLHTHALDKGLSAKYHLGTTGLLVWSGIERRSHDDLLRAGWQSTAGMLTAVSGPRGGAP